MVRRIEVEIGDGVVGQVEEPLADRGDELDVVAAREIGAADRAGKQHIANKGEAGRAVEPKPRFTKLRQRFWTPEGRSAGPSGGAASQILSPRHKTTITTKRPPDAKALSSLAQSGAAH